MLNLNCAQVFTINNPIEVMKRTDTANVNLMGTTTIYTRVGATGGGPSGTPGFSNGVPYTLEISMMLLDGGIDLTVRISDSHGWSISHTVTDNVSPATRFDSLAVRPNSAADTADSFTFTRFKVEVHSFAPRVLGLASNLEQLTTTVAWTALPGKSY